MAGHGGWFNLPPHPDDTRMSFGDHLEELRTHLWKAGGGFIAIVLACFLLDAIGYVADTRIGVARPIMDLIAHPVEQELRTRHQRRKDQALKLLQERTSETEIDLDIHQLAELLGLPGRETDSASPPRQYARLRARLPAGFWGPAIEEVPSGT